MNGTTYQLLGQRLVGTGSLDAAALASAVATQELTPHERLGAILVRTGALSEQTLLNALSSQLHVEVLAEPVLSECQFMVRSWHAAHGVPQARSNKLHFFAWSASDDANVVNVAAKDILNSFLFQAFDKQIACFHFLSFIFH